ncbi:glycosyltransferase involved in cell wall biosynthesis [Roseivirga ehrenbergii]|uniref:Glycosyl transferase family 1 n=1 Tax=Roseivirga ehrenbergii (strain DSM 102268 / JCM 13514 / KCTC 12282 / NCIMB 14502 / KMM 6017) TaxID=279360 RepID=A0A150XEG7_ROSEK|nr:glycosyltransferase family 4 protein [Roseivirga ehrenbergii]KYG77064.1 hypothetical protein MB14_02350 [Roseivirga ehrenbergii]TCL14433.1 glycosyltransferase involved in cell wall biosynthesis [Roseivirga ehrenbergii]
MVNQNKQSLKILRLTTIPMSLSLLLKGQFAYFQSKGFHVEVGSSQGPEICAIIQQEKVIHNEFPLSREISPIQDLRTLLQLIRFLRRNTFDIVHTHTPKAGLIGMMAAWFCRVPVRMHTVAGLPLMEARGFKRKILVWVEHLTYSCATKVYPNSFAQKDFILKNIYSNEKKIKVIGNGSSNGINCEYFQSNPTLVERAEELRLELGISRSQHVGVFVGRVTGDKGINELINAFKEFDNLDLILVGPFEPELDPLELSVMNEIMTNTRIHSVGFQADVRPYLLASDFLVFPSYREGFPNVPLQAGAMGLPSIVTNINGCNEIVLHEKNGLIVPPKDTEAISSAILRLLTDQSLMDNLKRNARDMIINRYDQKSLWEALHSEYLEQISKHVR